MHLPTLLVFTHSVLLLVCHFLFCLSEHNDFLYNIVLWDIQHVRGILLLSMIKGVVYLYLIVLEAHIF